MVAFMRLRSSEKEWRKGPWTHDEDQLLAEYVNLHGERNWSSVSRFSGLNRSGKSSRLRWVNYLKPGLKKGRLTPQEQGIIIELHALLGNKWSTIARYLPGRTDNEIKNYWRTQFKKKDHHKLYQNNNNLQNRREKMMLSHNEHQPQKYYDLKNLFSHEAYNTKSEPSIGETSENKEQAMIMDLIQNQTFDDQFYIPSMFQETCFPSVWQETEEDDSLWVSLWDQLDA